MNIVIKIFAPGATKPRFVGKLETLIGSKVDQPNTADLKLLWDVERAINNHIEGRCHIEIAE